MATLQDLIYRFQKANTLDSASVLTPEELEDPKTVQLSELAKQNVKADVHTTQMEQQEEAEDRAKKEKLATAFNLSPEERKRYMGPEKMPDMAPSLTSAVKPIPASQMPYALGKSPAEEAAKTAAYKPAEPAPAPPTDAVPKAPKTPAAPAATPLQSILGKFQTQVDKISGAAKTELSDKMGELNDLEKVYRQEAKDAKSDLERRELAETMGHALAQFGAGLTGLNTGVDMSSGLKFNKTDWNQRYNAALDELKANLADLREKRQEARLTTTEKAREGIQQAQFGTSLEASEAMQKERQKEAEKLASIQSGQASKEKELDRQVRREIAGIQATAKIAASNAKLGQKQQEAVDEAAANFTDAYETMQTGTTEERKAGLKEYHKYKAQLNTALGPDVVDKMEKKLKDVPWLTFQSTHLAKTGPVVSQELQRAVQQRRGAGGFTAPAGQSPGVSGTIKVKDTTQGSPTFGQVKAVKNSDKVQQLINEGKLQAVP